MTARRGIGLNLLIACRVPGKLGGGLRPPSEASPQGIVAPAKPALEARSPRASPSQNNSRGRRSSQLVVYLGNSEGGFAPLPKPPPKESLRRQSRRSKRDHLARVLLRTTLVAADPHSLSCTWEPA